MALTEASQLTKDGLVLSDCYKRGHSITIKIPLIPPFIIDKGVPKRYIIQGSTFETIPKQELEGPYLEEVGGFQGKQS